MQNLKIGRMVELTRPPKKENGYNVGNYRGYIKSFSDGKAIVKVILKNLNDCGFFYCKPFEVLTNLKDAKPLNVQLHD